MINLYTYPLTQNPLKVSLLINYLGLTIDTTIVTLPKLEQQQLNFLAINPNGTVPVLVDDAITITESNAILYYLAVKYDAPLWPQNKDKQILILQWLFWQESNWAKATLSLGIEIILKPFWGYSPNKDKIQRTLPLFIRYAQVLNQKLASSPYIVGQELTLADLAIAAFLFYPLDIFPLQDYPHILSWLKKLQDFPWWQKTHQDFIDFMSKKHANT